MTEHRWKNVDEALSVAIVLLTVVFVLWLFWEGGFDLVNALIRHWAGLGQ